MIDWRLIEQATDELLHGTPDISTWLERIALRKTMHGGKQQPLVGLYAVLEQAFRLTALKEQFQRANKPETGADWFSQYTEQHYQIDQTYRRLMSAFLRAGGTFVQHGRALRIAARRCDDRQDGAV